MLMPGNKKVTSVVLSTADIELLRDFTGLRQATIVREAVRRWADSLRALAPAAKPARAARD